ncbi:hypothetical protein [Bradyrhizobium sp.]|uniref:hypothetical protein n=1 Tax=Bradyrhizobium sp. TaxID=376 RepID=UPI003C23CE25
MGWFSIAVIVGFLLFWSWRNHLRNGPAGPDDGIVTTFSSFVARKAHCVLINFFPAVLAGLLTLSLTLFLLGKEFALIDAFNSGFL